MIVVYRGRLAGVGRTPDGRNVGFYQLGSKSYREREIARVPGFEFEPALQVVMKPGFEDQAKQNPDIVYRVMKETNGWLFVANGDHQPHIMDEFNSSGSMAQSIAKVLNEMGPEEDENQTPRIVVAVPVKGSVAWLGKVVYDRSLIVFSDELRAGSCLYIPISQELGRHPHGFFPTNDWETAKYVLNEGPFADHEHVIASAAGVSDGKKFDLQAAHPTDSS